MRGLWMPDRRAFAAACLAVAGASAAGFVARLATLGRMASSQAGLMPWAAASLGSGIGSYFCLREEPGTTEGLIAGAVIVLSLALIRLGGEGARAPGGALVLLAAGLLLMMLRSWVVAAPVLPYRYYGPVEGRIVDIDRSFSDAIRLTLDSVSMPDLRDAAAPARVRVALHGEDRQDDLEPGTMVGLTAYLAPPDGPVEPGGFDFQRLAWFSSLGAVGYSRDPVMQLAPADPWDMRLWAFRLRMNLSQRMQEGMGNGQAAALASAFMTGDRSGINAATTESMRASNLSHLISISGLHMGLITGFVFALIRGGLALCPPLALRLDTRKIAALVAALAATFYLALAGPDVATRRAYIMALVMMLAVLVDRRAISLRTVAISALVVLVLEPESLVEPGFQMSFAATVALVVGFAFWPRWRGRVPGLLRPVALAVMSSVIAGSATAPFAAVHFNRIAEYGLVANLLVTPIMGMVVMPAGVLALLLMPLGLAGPALWAMRWGSEAVIWVSDRVAALDGAIVPVVSPQALVLPLLSLSGLMFLAGGDRVLRGLGAAGLVAAFGLWAAAPRPDLLIASDGGLVGVLGAEGRILSRAKGSGFVAGAWLENDGDLADQKTAAGRSGFIGPKTGRQMQLDGRLVVHLTGKAAPGAVAGACVDGAVIVLNRRLAEKPEGACLIYDQKRLRRTGSVAGYVTPKGLHLVTARDLSGWRYWNSRRAREAILAPVQAAGADTRPKVVAGRTQARWSPANETATAFDAAERRVQ